MRLTVYPLLTKIRRGLGHSLTLRKDYLKGLSSFSTNVISSHGRGKTNKTVTIEDISEQGFPEIARILEKKRIKSIEFMVDNRTYFHRRKSYKQLIASSVRAAIRHLATYGKKDGLQRGFTDRRLSPDDESGVLIMNTFISSEIKIEAANESSVKVTFEIFELKR
jgi:hypothetical protein